MNYLEDLKTSFIEYQVRRSENEKKDFRAFIIKKLKENNLKPKVLDNKIQKNKHNYNITANLDNAKYIFIAHYDTPTTTITYSLSWINNIIKVYLGEKQGSRIVVIGIIIPMLIINEYFYNISLLIMILLLSFITLFIRSLYSLRIPNKNNWIDNTSGIITLLALANHYKGNENIGYILFDNEEKGLKGSKAFAKEHKNKEFNNKIIINLDCVSFKDAKDADTLLISYNKLAKKLKHNNHVEDTIRNTSDLVRSVINDEIGVFLKNYAASDYKSFNKNIAISFGRYKKSTICGYYLKNIHTEEDTDCNIEPINELVSTISEFIR